MAISSKKKILGDGGHLAHLYDEIVVVIEKGSVITKDNGIKILAKVASAI